MIGVTIAIGQKWEEVAKRAADAVREFTGLDTIIIKESKGHYHKYIQLRLFEFISGHDDLFYYDADTRMIHHWNPRAWVPRSRIGAVRAHWRYPQIQKVCNKRNIDPTQYPNCGLMILNRRYHRDIFELASSYPEMMENQNVQVQLATAMHDLDTPFCWLPRMFNWVRPVGPTSECMPVVIWHLIGVPRFNNQLPKNTPKFEYNSKAWQYVYNASPDLWEEDGSILNGGDAMYWFAGRDLASGHMVKLTMSRTHILNSELINVDG